jgi:amphi-Trp domain-containing protein
MSDVKVERKESLSRDDAATWLSLLARAFNTAGDHAELPFGTSSVSLHIPDRVRAELEVEVEGNEVEVEVEFKWSIAEHGDNEHGEKRPRNSKARKR